MTDTTPLSPAAQAVLDAYMNNCGWLDGPFEKDYRCAAAVLRAAVDQVLPEGYSDAYDCCLVIIGEIREELLAIANELDPPSS